MNYPLLRLTSHQTPPAQPPQPRQSEKSDTIDIRKLLVLIFDQRRLIAGIMLVVTLLGVAYAFMAAPVYQASILVQVEDRGEAQKNIPGDLSTAFELKTAAASETEVLRSRRVLEPAIETTHHYIHARPRYFPVIGAWLARLNKDRGLSTPGLLGFGGFAWGAEKIDVSLFNVPESLESKDFMLTAGSDGAFRLVNREHDIDLAGKVGNTQQAQTAAGPIELRVDKLVANPGARFELRRSPLIVTVGKLQEKLKINEKGRQSGVISVALEGEDRARTTRLLREIGSEYMRQNEARQSDAAERSLTFLENQLPDLKRQVEESEARYNEARNRYGTVNLNEEAKGLIQQSVFAQNKLLELNQKKEELLGRYSLEFPLVQTTVQQIRMLNRDIAAINARVKELPLIEKEIVKLSRDVEVNNSVYTSALSRAQQLRLAAATKAGNVRLLDSPQTPAEPIKPRRAMVIALAAAAGLVFGSVVAFLRKKYSGRIDYPEEIERLLGIPVSSSIPYSEQADSGSAIGRGRKAGLLLPVNAPASGAIESFRGLRAMLQVVDQDRRNNIILITGPTPGVGKSFVSANFSGVLAAIGKRVLLIDADLRTGHLHSYFGCSHTCGLSNVLAGMADPLQVVRKDVMENVDFIPVGDQFHNPAELLGKADLGSLLQRYMDNYDFILIDTAPLLLVSDALLVAPHAGSAFNVVRSGTNTEAEVEETVKRLVQTMKKAPHIVFNGTKPQYAQYGYSAYYGYPAGAA
jgi:tyrosine-protein kinase Etk/Wzc